MRTEVDQNDFLQFLGQSVFFLSASQHQIGIPTLSVAAKQLGLILRTFRNMTVE